MLIDRRTDRRTWRSHSALFTIVSQRSLKLDIPNHEFTAELHSGGKRRLSFLLRNIQKPLGKDWVKQNDTNQQTGTDSNSYFLNKIQCCHYTQLHSSERGNTAVKHTRFEYSEGHLAFLLFQKHLQLGTSLLSAQSDCDEDRILRRDVFVFIFPRNEDELICEREEKIDGGRLL